MANVESSLTITELVRQFIRAKRVEGLSKFTLTFYDQQLAHFTRFCDLQGVMVIAGVDANLLRGFLGWHAETGHNPGGLHAAYRAVRVFLFWFEVEFEPEGWKNPIARVKAPKVPVQVLDPAPVDDVQRMMKSCDVGTVLGARDLAVLCVLVDTGIRARELLAIDRDDFDPVTGEIVIQHGKGDKPRSVYLGAKAKRAVRGYLKLRDDDDPALFVTGGGERLRYGGLRGLVRRRAALAGVPAPDLHAFRRLFALSMLRAGVDLLTLSRLMGHTSLQMLSRYAKQINDDLAIAHAKSSPVDRMKGR
jgi:site-specific recombinase XerD